MINDNYDNYDNYDKYDKYDKYDNYDNFNHYYDETPWRIIIRLNIPQASSALVLAWIR